MATKRQIKNKSHPSTTALSETTPGKIALQANPMEAEVHERQKNQVLNPDDPQVGNTLDTSVIDQATVLCCRKRNQYYSFNSNQKRHA